jgi:hypothetical protein
MRLHVTLKGDLSKCKGFVGFPLGVHDESFHGQRISMLGVLLQDLVRSFDACESLASAEQSGLTLLVDLSCTACPHSCEPRYERATALSHLVVVA